MTPTPAINVVRVLLSCHPADGVCRLDQVFLSVGGGADTRQFAPDDSAAAAELNLAAFAAEQQHRSFQQQVRGGSCEMTDGQIVGSYAARAGCS